MFQSVIKGRGGRVETHFTGFVPASVKVTVAKPDGTAAVADEDAVVDPVATVSSAAAAQGDKELGLADVTGVVPRRRYLFGDEEVRVKAVTGSTVSLWQPLARDHAVNTAFLGMLVYYDLNSTQAADAWWNGTAVFTPIAGDPQVEVVDSTLSKIPIWLISELDLGRLWSAWQSGVDEDTDLAQTLLDARDAMLLDFRQQRPNQILGVDHFRLLATMKWFLMRAFEFGPGYRQEIEDLRGDYLRMMAGVESKTPEQADDGTTRSAAVTSAPDANLDSR